MPRPKDYPNATTRAADDRLLLDGTTNGTRSFDATKMGTVLSVAASGDGNISVAGSPVTATGTLSLSLANTTVAPGTYGSSSSVGTFSVDAKGRLTAAGDVSISFPVTSVAGRTGAVSLSSADVSGLGTAAAQNTNYFVLSSEKGVSSGVATLDGSGKLNTSQLPNLAVTEYLGTAASEAAMLALTGQKGDWVNRTDTGTVFIITGDNPSSAGSWTQLNYPTAPVTSVAGKTGAVTLTLTDIGGLGTGVSTALALPLGTAGSVLTQGGAIVGTTGAFSGNVGIGTIPSLTNNANRLYVTAVGSADAGVFRTSTPAADADNALLGVYQFDDRNSTSGSTRVGYLAARLSGTTANNRGSLIQIAAKADGGVEGVVATFTSTGMNGTAIGATTPSTGAFTTLSATGAVTFDGISFADGAPSNTLVTNTNGNVAIGNSIAYDKLDVFGNATIRGSLVALGSIAASITGGGYVIHEVNNGTAGGGLAANGAQIELRANTNHPISFQTNAVERMRIAASGNVGIGTSSPGFKLAVTGDIKITSATTGALRFSNGESTTWALVQYDDSNGHLNVGTPATRSYPVNLMVGGTNILSASTTGVSVTGDVTTSGLFVQRKTTFTPTTVGWYRICAGGGDMSGRVTLTGNWDGGKLGVVFDYVIRGYGQRGTITLVRGNLVNGGILNKVRISSDGGGNVYLDVYVNSATAPGLMAVYAEGPYQPALVASPVVGAVAGSTDVYTLLIDNSSTAIYSTGTLALGKDLGSSAGINVFEDASGNGVFGSLSVNKEIWLSSYYGTNTIKFGDWNNNAAWVTMSAGNVGIGVTPSNRLHVRGTVDTVAVFENNGGNNCYINLRAGTNLDSMGEISWEREAANTGNFYYGGNATGRHIFRSNGYAARLSINGDGTLRIYNGSAPTTNPTGGGFLYVENGALKYRGSSGTVTDIADA